MVAITDVKAVESCRWPAMMMRDSGRARRSAASTILVESPPRERPKASRSTRQSLSFDRSPWGPVRGVQVGGRCAAGTGSVLMGAHHGAIDRDRPVRAVGLVTPTAQLIQQPGPHTVDRPAAVTVIDRLPVPITRRQVPPGSPSPRSPRHRINHQPVIHPPTTPTRRPIRQQRLQPRPLLMSQIMPIKHTQPSTKHPPPRSTGHALAEFFEEREL